jgi:ubiquinone/menaquinone biosynthesis C-methylase UbiE
VAAYAAVKGSVKHTKTWRQSSTYQILFGSSIVPACVPLHYRVYLLWRKLPRSVKKLFSKDRRTDGIMRDILAGADRSLTVGEATAPVINKTFSHLQNDMERADVKAIAAELVRLQESLRSKGLQFTSAAGSFKSKDYVAHKEQNKMWENTWILAHALPSPQETVLDLGGASTIFSFYLGERGCRTYCVDNDWGCHGIVHNGRYVAKKMGWPITIYNRDLAVRLPFADCYFDKVFCICVLEHLSSSVRRHVMREIRRVLKPGGVAAFTVDYDSKRNDPGTDKGIRYMFKETLLRDVLLPAGLEVMGNQNFIDDCPEDFFLATLFLTKPR